MGAFFVYILKSSVCLAIFYLFYRLLLSRDTFYRFNRIALLGIIILSVIVPFVQLSVEEPVVMNSSILNIEELLLMAAMVENTVTGTPLWIRILLWLYIIGGAFFLIQFVSSCFRLLYIIRKGESIPMEKGIRLIIANGKTSPFSWGKYIVISRQDYEESAEEILTHEVAHVNSRHSLDVLFVEASILFHWFNPAIWLLKQELQNIHEYEADEAVLSKGIDAKKYQLLLIKKAVGSQRFTSMANSFNHSSLKKRITMMLKSKSNPWARLKYLYVLPLAAIAVAAFARPEISGKLEEISSVKISEIVSVKEIKNTETIESTPTLLAELEVSSTNMPLADGRQSDNKRAAAEKGKDRLIQEHQEKMNEKVRQKIEEAEKFMQENREELDKMIAQKHSEIDKLIKEKFPDTEKNIKERQAEIDKMMAEIQPEIDKMMAEKMPEIEKIIKEREIEMHKIMEQKHEEIELLIRENESELEEKVKDEYEKNGIKPKTPSRQQQQLINNSSAPKEEEDTRLSSLKFFPTGDLEPLIIVDGVEKDNKDLSKLDPNTIESISVIKEGGATTEYGEKAKYGLILITTKKV